MSGALTAIAVASVATAAYSVYNGEQQRAQQGKALEQQKQAQSQALEASQKQEKTAEENINKANAKAPDTNALMSAASKGAPGTMLTGPTGVDPNALALGKNTLLGG